MTNLITKLTKMVVRMWCYREPIICHYANYNDNFLCLLWWQSWHHDNYPFSVHCRHLGPETVYINSLLFDYSAADLDHHWSRQWHTKLSPYPLRWRHNGRDRVSNHQPHHGLLYRLFRRRSMKTSPAFVWGIHRGPVPWMGTIMATHHQMDPRELASLEFSSQFKFYFTKMDWKMSSSKWPPFCSQDPTLMKTWCRQNSVSLCTHTHSHAI